MDFMTASGADMRAARTITGATMASLFLVGLIPGLRPYAGRIRICIAVTYLIAAAGFVIYLLVR
jgi:uncharacterized membrane protein